MRALVLGGYGNFGARICRGLAGDPAIDVLVGGRDADRAAALAATLGPGAVGVGIDLTSAAFAHDLRRLGAELLIHTAGPFQQQGYGVAWAAAEAGAHYIDLSDGRRFVCDFPQALDAAFRAAGRVAITGASTVPGLSSAVVDALCAGWRRIDSIDTCIAPAQTAPRGQATLESVLGYCGEPLQVWEGGRWQVRRGWAQPQPVRFARLRPRLGALCDIPDLELFLGPYRVDRRVMFRAALEVRLAQRMFAALAALKSWGLLARPAALAALLNRAGRLCDPFGSALGGMVVAVEGIDADGRTLRRTWNIAADHDHGPEIPCMPALLLARRLARGEAMPSGAKACLGLLALGEFQPEFDRWRMVVDVQDEVDPAASQV